MTNKEPKNTDTDWGASEKLPLKRRMRRWIGVVAFIVAVHLVLAYLLSIPLVRHYAFIGRIIYDSTIGQVWRDTRESLQAKDRLLSLPDTKYNTVSAGLSYTGYSTSGQRDSIVWVNDEVVLFTGRKDKPPETTFDQPDIYQWAMGGETTLYQANAHTECFADGKLLYWRLDRDMPSEKQMVYYYGDIGHEAVFTDFARVDKVSCKPLSRESLNVKKRLYGARLALRDGDGSIIYRLIAITNPEPDGPIILEKADGTTVNLPINNTEHMTGIRIKYYPYKISYLFSPSTSTQTSLQRLWWIYPDGNAESIPAPRKLAYGQMYSTREGLIYSGYANKNSDKRSLFLAKPDGGIEQLMKDDVRVEDIAVSPNGCKIAFFAFNMLRHRQNFGPWVYSIDFCQPDYKEQ